MCFTDVDDNSLVLVVSFIHPRDEGRLRVSVREAYLRLREYSLLPSDCLPFISFPCLISLLWPAPDWERGWSNARSTSNALALENIQGTWLHENGNNKILVNGRLVMVYDVEHGRPLIRYGATGTIAYNKSEGQFELSFDKAVVAAVGHHKHPDVLTWSNTSDDEGLNSMMGRTWTRPLKETQTRDRLVRFSENCLEDLRNLHLMAMRRSITSESWSKLTPSLCLGDTVVQVIPRDAGKLWDAVLACRVGTKFDSLRFGPLKPPAWRSAVEQRKAAGAMWVQRKEQPFLVIQRSVTPAAVEFTNYELLIEIHAGLPVNNSEVWRGGPWNEASYNEHKAVSFPVFAHTTKLCNDLNIEGDVAFAAASHHDAPFLDPIASSQVSPRTIFLSATLRRKSDGAITCLASFSEASDFVFSPWDGVSRCGVPFSFCVDMWKSEDTTTAATRYSATFEAWAVLNKNAFPGNFAVDNVSVSLLGRLAPLDGLNPVQSTAHFVFLIESTEKWT